MYKRQLIDRTKLYESAEALDLAVQTAKAKFDETIEVHVRPVSYTHLDVYKRQPTSSALLAFLPSLASELMPSTITPPFSLAAATTVPPGHMQNV